MKSLKNITKTKIIKILNKIKKKNYKTSEVDDNYFDFYKLDSLDILNLTFELDKIKKKNRKNINPSLKKFRSLKYLISNF